MRDSSLLQALFVIMSLFICDSASYYHDKYVNTFNPEGKIEQVQYAEKATEYGSVLAGIIAEDQYLLLCTSSAAIQTFLDRKCIDKIEQVDDEIWATFSGFAGDGRYLIKSSRQFSTKFRHKFGCAPSVSAISKAIGDYQHGVTLSGGC
jgi:20S proteasome alpha/beta subunit